MRLAMLAGLAVLGALALQATPDLVTAASAQQAAAQNERQSRTARPRPQIRVSPRYPYRAYHSPYPVPYAADYPGPNGVRHCVDRYVTEHRPSGTVIVPRMRCQWVVRR
jgi:hypothetical protein